MPRDELADGTAILPLNDCCARKLQVLTIAFAEAPRVNDKRNGDDDVSDPATAEIRLQQEAQWLSKKPVSFVSRGVRDVTEDFVAASNQLRPGELVKDEYFTLFEAVGALEVC